MIDIVAGDRIFSGPDHNELLQSLGDELLVLFSFTPPSPSTTGTDQTVCRVVGLLRLYGDYHEWYVTLQIDSLTVLARYNDQLNEGYVVNGDLNDKLLTVTPQGIVAGGRVIGQVPQSTFS